MQADVYNLQNEKVGTMELPASVFGAKRNATLVKQVLEAQLANKRHPWAHTKTRAEISGGGRKPWRQKGTGRARHGSTRSPLWVGGGIAHGPRNDRDYSQKVNKKMKRAALFAVLSQKAKEGEVKFFDTFAIEAPKTKILASALNIILAMKKTAKKGTGKNPKRYDVLLVAANAGAANKNLFRASSNLQKTKALDAASLNIYDILNHKNLFMDKEAVATIEKHYKG
jgi:large subunit ribosomal protein L4